MRYIQFDQNTTIILDKLFCAEKLDKEKLFPYAQQAFIDYLASYLLALDQKVIQQTGQLYHQTGQMVPLFTNFKLAKEQAAFFYGFTSHYLDIDDAHPHVQGHPSAVIFSALLAVCEGEETWEDFFTSYILALEFEGLLGKEISSFLKEKGWHVTAVLGSLAAAIAVGILKKYSREEMTRLLSLVSIQPVGMSFQFGTDTKPLQVGLAAKQVVSMHQLVKNTDIQASSQPFAVRDGWFKTLLDEPFDLFQGFSSWLNPAQIVSPGLWFKTASFCSAAMTGHDAAVKLWHQGIKMHDIQTLKIHFSPQQDRPLRYARIENGTQGKFSIEYIVWQVLTYGKTQEAFFATNQVPIQYFEDLSKITRQHDLPIQAKMGRQTKLTVYTKKGEEISISVEYPKGSPNNPLSIDEIFEKVNLLKQRNWLKQLYEVLQVTNQKISFPKIDFSDSCVNIKQILKR